MKLSEKFLQKYQIHYKMNIAEGIKIYGKMVALETKLKIYTDKDDYFTPASIKENRLHNVQKELKRLKIKYEI